MEDEYDKKGSTFHKTLYYATSIVGLIVGLITLHEYMKSPEGSVSPAQTLPMARGPATAGPAAIPPASAVPSSLASATPATVQTASGDCRYGASSDYVIADSDRRAIGSAELSGLTAAELRIARNEIFARHGYRFKSDLKYYFPCKSWYHATTDNVEGQLGAVELQNVDTIRRAEGG